MAGFGETLRQARAQKNVTLRQAEADTRINRHYLAAMEDEEFDALPHSSYSRGMVRKYAEYLGLDAGKILDMYRGITGDETPQYQIHPKSEPRPVMWTPNFAIMAFGVVLTAIVFAWGYSIWLSPEQPGDVPVPTAITSSDNPNRAADTPRPTPPAAPTAQVTEAASVKSGGDNQAGQIDQPVYRTGIGISATAETHVTVAVDGTVVFDDILDSGMSTDLFVGTDFTVTTSNGSTSYFFNSCGTSSTEPMDAAGGEYSVSFSAHSQSCAPPADN